MLTCDEPWATGGNRRNADRIAAGGGTMGAFGDHILFGVVVTNTPRRVY